jgi:hypothetical protein
MDEFSYSSDIAPLRKDYFSDLASARGLTEREKQSLGSQYAASLNASLDSQIKSSSAMVELQSQIQRQSLAFQEAQLKLQQARKQIQDELAFEQVKPELESTLNSILSDPTKDAPTKMMDLAKTRNQIFSKIGANAQVNSIFEANAEAVKTKDIYSQQRNQAAYAAAQLGDKTAVEKIVGKDTEQGLIYGTLADAAAAENVKKGEAATQSSLADQIKKERETVLGNWKDEFQFLKGLEEKNKMGVSTGENKFGEGAAQPVEGELFDKVDRAKLEVMYKKLNPYYRNKPTGRDVIPDIKLFTETYGGTLNTIETLSGGKPESSISEKSK